MPVRTCLVAFTASLVFVTAPLFARQHEHHAGGDAQHQPGTPDHMAHRFDDAEAYAKSFDDPARDEWQMPDRVIDALGLRAGEAIADIGAGTGYFTVRLAKRPQAPLVYGVDVEPSMLEYMKKRAEREGLKNVTPVLATSDSANLPVPVDLVLIVDTYHHLPDRVAYFKRLRDSMRPGAQLAIIDFRKDSPSGPPVEFRFTEAQISDELAQAGFTLASKHDFLPRQQFLVYTVGGPHAH